MNIHEEIGRNRHELIRQWTLQLYAEFEAVCYHYRVELERPVLRIESLKRRWGTWDPTTRTITIASELIVDHSWNAVIEVLKHEMAHMIVNETFGIPDHTHGEAFKRAAARLGIDGWASAAEDDWDEANLDWKGRKLSGEDERLLKKVEKLLALAQSQNEHEALLAMKRVRELYAKYNIDRLRQNRKTDYVYTIIDHGKRVIPQHQSMVASMLARHFFVEVVFSELYDAKACRSHKVLEVMGTPENVQMAEYVYWFLWHKLSVLWLEYKERTGAGGRSKKSYFLGVLTGFDVKLGRETPKDTGETQATPAADTLGKASTTQLMRLAEAELQQFVSTRHPRLAKRRWDSSLADSTSYYDGRHDGERLVLNKGIHHRASGEVRLIR